MTHYLNHMKLGELFMSLLKKNNLNRKNSSYLQNFPFQFSISIMEMQLSVIKPFFKANLMK